MKRGLFLFPLLFFIVLTKGYCDEMSDTFIVKIFDRKIKVSSPKKIDGKMAVILENKTLNKVYGKISTDYRLIKHISIDSQKSISVPFKIHNYEKLSFTPLAPAFQSVALIPGKSSYEIPPKE